jgi:hypothetical protein
VWRSRRCPARCAALRGLPGGAALRAAAAPLRAAGALRPLRRRAAGAAPSSHGLLVPCARSAAGRPAAVAATAAPHLPARSGLTRGNADSAATTPRSNTPLFRGRANTAGNDSAPRQPPRAASAVDADGRCSRASTSHRLAYFLFFPVNLFMCFYCVLEFIPKVYEVCPVVGWVLFHFLADGKTDRFSKTKSGRLSH